MTKKMLLLAGVVLANAYCVFAQASGTLTDPIEILRRADAAAKAVQVVQYDAKAFSLSPSGKASGVAEGKGTFEGFSGEAPRKFRASGFFNRRGSNMKHELAFGSNGESVYLIDAKKKKAYVGFDFDVFGSRGELLLPLLLAEFVVTEPFSDEISSENPVLVGTTTVGDEDCYELLVQYANKRKARWFFSTSDFLPRRVDRFSTDNERPAHGTRLVVTSLKTDPSLERNFYEFKLPAGFEQTDDAAP